eukprot:scaffold18488_cov59-Cyclotella_meneghiniana.AAC.10
MTISNREEEKEVRSSHYSQISTKSRTHQRHVEIATLTFPAKAHTRVESGDTSTFILEAPSHVIDHLVDNDQLSELQNATYRSSEISQSKATNPHIEGVVDLEMVSHLVTGVTESEFVHLLQPDLAHTEHGKHVEPSQKDEESQLLGKSTNEDTSCIVVPSDPFLNVTAEFHEEVSVEYAGLSSINETKVASNHSPYPMGAENANVNISTQREAYLLSIPTKEGGDIDCNAISIDGDTSMKAEDSVFLLAVPEMTTTSGSMRTSAITHNTLHTSADDIQNRIEHPFTPLPTDVVLRKPVLFLEGAGAAIGMVGALFCAYTGSDNSEDHSSSSAMAGNVLAFLASVATASYLTVAKTLRPRVDLFVFMLLIFSYASVAVLLYMIFMDRPYKISTDPTIGLFGWVNLKMDRLPLELWMAIVCNLLGTTGYIAIMKYFDPVVVSMVMLMEPIVASVMGAICGVSSLPSLMTWAGDGVVVVGSILVILSGSKKTETIDATNTLKKVNEELTVEGKPVLLRRSSMSTKTPTLKRSVVLRSPRKKYALHKERKAVEEESHHRDSSMEFVFVGNKSRDTTVSSIRDSDVIRGIRLPGTGTSLSNLEL